jgi:hypothetical protein
MQILDGFRIEEEFEWKNFLRKKCFFFETAVFDNQFWMRVFSLSQIQPELLSDRFHLQSVRAQITD